MAFAVAGVTRVVFWQGEPRPRNAKPAGLGRAAYRQSRDQIGRCENPNLPLKDHFEAVGHKDALDYVRQVAGTSDPIRENDVRQIHSLVMGRVDPQGAGRYAGHQRLISGTSYVPPSPAEIVPLMGDFGQWLSKAPATAETAIKAHERVAVIHPFEDGNGRAARLLMNLVLMKGGYPPVVIGPEQRPAYIDGLNALTVGRDPLAYRQFMTDRLDASLDHHLDMLRRGLEPAPKQAPGLKL